MKWTLAEIKLWSWAKKAFIVGCVFALWVVILGDMIGVYDDDVPFYSFCFTVLTVFLWKRLSKKFNF